MAERLSAVLRRFELALDLGTPTDAVRRVLKDQVGTLIAVDAIAEHLRQAGSAVAADAEALPFRDASIDLIVSGLALQWANDLPGALIQIRKAGFCTIRSPRGRR